MTMIKTSEGRISIKPDGTCYVNDADGLVHTHPVEAKALAIKILIGAPDATTVSVYEVIDDNFNKCLSCGQMFWSVAGHSCGTDVALRVMTAIDRMQRP